MIRGAGSRGDPSAREYDGCPRGPTGGAAQRACSRTSAMPTSPAIRRLYADTLSRVSSGVCHQALLRPIVEIHHVDRLDPGLLQLHVVVGKRDAGLRHERRPVADLPRGSPDQVHDIGRPQQAVALLEEPKLLVRHQVEQHRIQRPGTGGQVLDVVPGTDQDIGLFAVEVAVVLAIDEEQVHPHCGRVHLHGVRHAQQDRHTRGPIVGPRDGTTAVAGVGGIVGDRSGVPVGQEQDALGRGRAEPRQEVTERKRVSPGGHVVPRLDDHRIGALAQAASPATPRCARARASRESGTRTRPAPRDTGTPPRHRTPGAAEWCRGRRTG